MPDPRLGLWLLALDRYELQLRVQAGRARNAAIIHAAYAYQATGSLPAYIADAHRRRLKQVLADHYAKVIPHFAAQALAGIKSHSVGHTAAALVASGVEIKLSDIWKTKSSRFDSHMQEWIGRESLRKATMIASTDTDDIRGAIADGVGEGLGTAEIASNIRKVSQLTPFRAAVVARTETHAAATFGSIESVRDAEQTLGVQMLKEWLATRDARTRLDHLAADGQQVPLNEKFLVGGSPMDRPGDPSAPPDQTINCRCALGYTEANN